MALRDIVPSRRRGELAGRRENPFAALQREMNDLFEDFWRGSRLSPFWREGAAMEAFAPRVDVTEDEKEVLVTAELPGIDEKEIDLTLSRDSLTIRGEKKEEHEEKGQNHYRMERSYGSFQRVIALPAEVDEEKVQAEFKKGVLTVHLPKSEKAQEHRKKIEVKGD